MIVRALNDDKGTLAVVGESHDATTTFTITPNDKGQLKYLHINGKSNWTVTVLEESINRYHITGQHISRPITFDLDVVTDTLHLVVNEIVEEEAGGYHVLVRCNSLFDDLEQLVSYISKI